MRRLVLAAVLVTTLPISRSLACTCSGPQHEWAIKASSAVFAAEVLARKDHPTSEFLSRYPLRVFAVWKGDVPESTYVDVEWSGACGFPFEVGHRYLIYMAAEDIERRDVHLCSGTSQLEYLYYDRYLLGEPVTRYAPDFETVTLETMLDLVAQEGSEDSIAWQFSNFTYEAELLLPRLLRIANGCVPGNQIAAMRAISALGTSAESAYAHLEGYRLWGGTDPAINAERILAMASVCGDFARMKPILVRTLADSNPVIRRAAVRSFASFGSIFDSEELAWLVSPALRDDDADVRIAALRVLRYNNDADVARRAKTIMRSDPNERVRDAARDYLKWRYRWSTIATPHGTLRDRGLEYMRN